MSVCGGQKTTLQKVIFHLKKSLFASAWPTPLIFPAHFESSQERRLAVSANGPGADEIESFSKLMTFR
jgi:hypothetical protein